MMCAVMKHWDIMIGVDLHLCWPPGDPEPIGHIPYFVVMLMIGTSLTAMYVPTAMTVHGMTMQRGTDIGPLIPHVGPPSLLTPLDILFSSSASYFGSSAYVVGGLPAAAAVMTWVNRNLNCNQDCPLPTGLVLCFTTHYVNMSLWDILFGVLTMALAVAIEVASGAVAGAGASAVQRKIMQPLGKRISAKMASRKAVKAAGTKVGKAVGSGAGRATGRASAASSKAGAGAAAKAAPAGKWVSATPSNAGAAAPSAPAGKWVSATPSKGGAAAKAAPEAKWVPAKPSKPGATSPPEPEAKWVPAKPSKPGATSPTEPEAKWVPAKPSKPGATGPTDATKPTIGGHRPPAEPTKPSRKQVTAKEFLTDFGLDLVAEGALGMPFSLVNELTLELLAATGIEEFGAAGSTSQEEG